MAGVATKKRGGDEAVQLTFPTVFEYTAAAEGLPQMMMGMTPGHQRDIPAASLDDLQEAYHEQKRVDAARMAMAKVQSTKNAELYYLSSPHGYKVPKPVLSQRRFANPSNGAAGLGGDLYTARRDPEGLVGGVLRTKVAQKWGATQLQNRVTQLDAINEAKAAFETGVAMDQSPVPLPVQREVEQGLPSKEVSLMVELNTYRQALLDALASGELNRFALTDFARFLSLFFRIAPTAHREELEDIKDGADSMGELMTGVREQAAEGFDTGRRGVHEPEIADFVGGVGQLVKKVIDYVNQMLAAVDRQPRERLALSKALVRSLGFTKQLTRVERQGVTPAPMNVAEAARRPGRDDDGDDDEDGGDHFTRPRPTREDDAEEEQRRGESAALTGRFNRDTRQVFGARQGAYLGEALTEADLPDSVQTNAFRRARPAEMSVRAATRESEAPAFSDVSSSGVSRRPRRRRPAAAAAAAAAADSSGYSSTERLFRRGMAEADRIAQQINARVAQRQLAPYVREDYAEYAEPAAAAAAAPSSGSERVAFSPRRRGVSAASAAAAAPAPAPAPAPATAEKAWNQRSAAQKARVLYQLNQEGRRYEELPAILGITRNIARKTWDNAIAKKPRQYVVKPKEGRGKMTPAQHAAKKLGKRVVGKGKKKTLD